MLTPLPASWPLSITHRVPYFRRFARLAARICMLRNDNENQSYLQLHYGKVLKISTAYRTGDAMSNGFRPAVTLRWLLCDTPGCDRQAMQAGIGPLRLALVTRQSFN